MSNMNMSNMNMSNMNMSNMSMNMSNMSNMNMGNMSIISRICVALKKSGLKHLWHFVSRKGSEHIRFYCNIVVREDLVLTRVLIIGVLPDLGRTKSLFQRSGRPGGKVLLITDIIKIKGHMLNPRKSRLQLATMLPQ